MTRFKSFSCEKCKTRLGFTVDEALNQKVYCFKCEPMVADQLQAEDRWARAFRAAARR